MNKRPNTQVPNVEFSRNVSDEFLSLVYDELRQLAAVRLARENPGHTLQATALVHEAYLRLIKVQDHDAWENRGHFFAAAAEAMRRILVDRARHKRTVKAGGSDHARIELSSEAMQLFPNAENRDTSIDLIVLNDALAKLADQHPRRAQLVNLRFFAGLTVEQAADALEISTSTADNDWAYAKAWLLVQMRK